MSLNVDWARDGASEGERAGKKEEREESSGGKVTLCLCVREREVGGS